MPKVSLCSNGYCFITNGRSGVPTLYSTVMHSHIEPNSVQCRFLDIKGSGHASLWIFDADSSAPDCALSLHPCQTSL